MAPASDSADLSVKAKMDQTAPESSPSPLKEKEVVPGGGGAQSSSSQPVTVPSHPPLIRESMITTAVKFLQNPQVQNSPISQRKAFLKKKGLSDEEIRISIERSGVKEPVGNPSAAVHQPSSNVPALPSAAPPPPPPRTIFSTAREYTSLAVIISGVTYAIYKFFQKYILPYFKSQGDTAKQVQNIEVSINQLNSTLSATVEEIQMSVGLIQTSLEKQEAQLEQLSREVTLSKTLTAGRGNDGDMLQIKQEISSLKGLLLSRHQFPSAPQQSSIPAWQRKTPSTSQDGHPENGIENGTASSGEDTPKKDDPEDNERAPASDTKVFQLKKSMLENGAHEGDASTEEGGLTGGQSGTSPELEDGRDESDVTRGREAD